MPNTKRLDSEAVDRQRGEEDAQEREDQGEKVEVLDCAQVQEEDKAAKIQGTLKQTRSLAAAGASTQDYSSAIATLAPSNRAIHERAVRPCKWWQYDGWQWA